MCDAVCRAGFWDWTWWCVMRPGTPWTRTAPAPSACSGPTSPRLAASTTGSRRRRHGPATVCVVRGCPKLLLPYGLAISKRSRTFRRASSRVVPGPVPQTRLQNLESRRQSLFSTVHTYSLLMNLKNFVCNIGEDSELLMSLYDPDQSEFIRSEVTVSRVHHGNQP